MIKIHFADHNNVLADIKNEFITVEDTSSADALVIWNDVLSDYRNMVLNASLNGKPTLVMQHGLRATREYCPPYNKLLFADKIMVWGPRDKQRLFQAGIEEERISITGTTIFEHLIPRQKHKGINVVYAPMHWYEDLEENKIVAEKLRKIPDINITTKIVDGGASEYFDNPVISHTYYPDHLHICASVLSTADLVVSVNESTFEFLAHALDIPVLVVDVWKPKFHMGRLFLEDINSDNSPACRRVSLEDLPEAIVNMLSSPGKYALERKKALLEDAGIGLDSLTPRQRIINTINQTVEYWKNQPIIDKQGLITKITKRISEQITLKEDATQRVIGQLQLNIQEMKVATSKMKKPLRDCRINLMDYPITFSIPRKIDDFDWVEHLPFGMFIIDLVRPHQFVESGTYRGVSYCGFCQAAKSLGLDTRGYAISNWGGDDHKGIDGEQVLVDLQKYHDPLYSNFSKLVQSSIDDAVKLFQDNSIDLLHVDGLQTYDIANHNFESWLPKLSQHALVLFHDTYIRGDGFSVWKFWEEVKQKYPHFEFFHGNGLGVLGVGKDLTDKEKQFLSIDDEKAIQARDFFSALGSRWKSEQEKQVLLTVLQNREKSLKE
jgi:hypothetical protein